MRHLLIASLSALALVQAGCDRRQEETAQSSAEQPPAAPGGAAPQAAAPAPVAAILAPEGQFEAVTNTAMSVTGDLTAAAGALSFAQGQSYGLSGVAVAKGADPYASTKASFASLINVPDAAELRVFKVSREEKGQARNGGLCGADAATYVVTHQGVDGGGSPALFVVAFKGAAAPSASTPEADLCGTYMYAPKGAAQG